MKRRFDGKFGTRMLRLASLCLVAALVQSAFGFLPNFRSLSLKTRWATLEAIDFDAELAQFEAEQNEPDEFADLPLPDQVPREGELEPNTATDALNLRWMLLDCPDAKRV